jgi:hypothetical protein
VVYSCGAIIHNNSLILPYAVSDYSSTYGVVDIAELLCIEKSITAAVKSVWNSLNPLQQIYKRILGVKKSK